MAAPKSAITRFDLSLSYEEFSLMANQQKFVGLRVLPPVGVARQSGDFLKIEVESLLGPVEDTERAARGTYRRGDFRFTKDSFAAEDHGVEEEVDDETVDRYDDILRAERIHAERAVNRVLQALENEIAAAVFNTTTWTGAALTTAVGTAWTTAATATPLADIDAATDKVETSCGQEPNALVLSKKAYRAILRTTEIQDLVKYDLGEVLVALNTGQNQELVNRVNSGLQELFQLENIIVGRGMKNSANEGASATFARYWDETMAMVCRINNDGLDGDLEAPTAHIGRTIFWTPGGESLPGAADTGRGGLVMEEYREEQRRGSVLRARNHRQIKILHAEAGHLLTGVTA